MKPIDCLYKAARPLLFRMDPETAHNATLKALAAGLVPSGVPVRDNALETVLWGRKFPNPVGLAAGFDKNAQAVGPLFGLGFGFVEAGTVTPRPQAGNPRPRVFRDEESESVINAMGFPNGGLTEFRANIEKFLKTRPRQPGILGINIGMNKDQSEPAKDYRLLIRHLGPLADYLTVNISSPNTPGLRDLQKKENLSALLKEIMEERAASCGGDPPPVLVKLAPDLTEPQREEVAGAVLDALIDGLILGNTTLDRPVGLPSSFSGRKGGLSGAPLRQKATALVRDFYRMTGGRIPLIGLGGISTGEDAYEKIRAGASLVQLYTALVYRGPGVARRINEELLQCLRRDGFASAADAVGADA